MPENWKPSSSVNWLLWSGILLVIAIGVMSFIGPRLAPADPLQESYIGKVGERYIKPPFPPNAVEGYPLGSDEFGRDLLSRLLWAIRPTMTLVLVVAAVRLALGILVGLVTGWKNTWFSRLLDTLISASLTAPVFFVALCVIAFLGSKWGIWAFILGLSITGWAESARIVREQTRSLKSQTFVEASRAMGAAPEQLILSHILPHVLPMMWIQLAFEISGTLLATAALGFLGYYMNGIWVAVGDWVGQRTTGYPELSEMLGAATTLHVPWSALFAGTLVVFIVLSFNILGEGLRQQLNPDRQRRRADMTRGSVQVTAWMEEKVYVGIQGVAQLASANGVVLLLGVLLVGGIWMIWSSQTSAEAKTVVTVPGGHLWAASKHDAQGTYWTNVTGPSQAGVEWTFSPGVRLASGPVVNAAGQVFVSSFEGYLYAIDSNGQMMWQLKLPNSDDVSRTFSGGGAYKTYGSLALAPDGNIMVVDDGAALSAISPSGKLLWTAKFTEGERAIGGPVVGANGITYFPTNIHLIAVYPSGNLRFLVPLPTYSVIDPVPRLSMDGKYLFFEDTVVDAETGDLLFDQTSPPMDSYIVGADGKNYNRAQDGMNEWQPTDKGYVLVKRSTFDARVLSLDFRRPQEAGVSPGGNEWVLFSAGFDIPRFIWMDTRRNSTEVFNFPTQGSSMIGIDQAGRLYLCSNPIDTNAFCRAVNVATGNVDWDFDLPAGAGFVGGAIVPDRLYVAIGAYLYALGPAAGGTQAAPTPTPTELPTPTSLAGDCSFPVCKYPETTRWNGKQVYLPLVVNVLPAEATPEQTPYPAP